MYVPSIFKSVQQIVTTVNGNYGIAATDVNYTRISCTNQSSNGYGVNNYQYVIIQQNATTVYIETFPDLATIIPQRATVHVEEYVPFFFRRPFIHGFGTIQSMTYNTIVSTGIAFGPKAFAVTRGWNTTIGRKPDGPEPSDNIFLASLSLNQAAGQLTIARSSLDLDYLYQGVVNHYYTIIDPW